MKVISIIASLVLAGSFAMATAKEKTHKADKNAATTKEAGMKDDHANKTAPTGDAHAAPTDAHGTAPAGKKGAAAEKTHH